MKKMEDKINYREEIQKALTFIPDEYLEPIYKVIQLIAKPFIKEKEEREKLNKEVFKNYIQEIRTGFGFYFEENSKLNAEYYVGENLSYVCFSVVQSETFEENIQIGQNSIESLLEEKEVPIEIFEQKLQDKGKVSLYEANSFYIVKDTKLELWKIENAQEDAKEEIAKVLAKLPNYSKDEV